MRRNIKIDARLVALGKAGHIADLAEHRAWRDLSVLAEKLRRDRKLKVAPRPQCGRLAFWERLKPSVGNVCANLDICCRQDKLEMVRASSASMSEVDPIDHHSMSDRLLANRFWIASLLSFAAGAAVIIYLEFSWGWAGYFAVPAGIAGFIVVPALWDLSLGFLERRRNY